eukprot:854111-Ditylum_brightwellii.AAC.1
MEMNWMDDQMKLLEELILKKEIENEDDYKVGDNMYYCSKSYYKAFDRVGTIACVTKECAWVKVEGSKNTRRLKKHPS